MNTVAWVTVVFVVVAQQAACDLPVVGLPRLPDGSSCFKSNLPGDTLPIVNFNSKGGRQCLETTLDSTNEFKQTVVVDTTNLCELLRSPMASHYSLLTLAFNSQQKPASSLRTTVRFSEPPGVGGIRAAGNVVVAANGRIERVAMTYAGKGYTSGEPTITVMKGTFERTLQTHEYSVTMNVDGSVGAVNFAMNDKSSYRGGEVFELRGAELRASGSRSLGLSGTGLFANEECGSSCSVHSSEPTCHCIPYGYTDSVRLTSLYPKPTSGSPQCRANMSLVLTAYRPVTVGVMFMMVLNSDAPTALTPTLRVGETQELHIPYGLDAPFLMKLAASQPELPTPAQLFLKQLKVTLNTSSSQNWFCRPGSLSDAVQKTCNATAGMLASLTDVHARGAYLYKPEVFISASPRPAQPFVLANTLSNQGTTFSVWNGVRPRVVVEGTRPAAKVVAVRVLDGGAGYLPLTAPGSSRVLYPQLEMQLPSGGGTYTSATVNVTGLAADGSISAANVQIVDGGSYPVNVLNGQGKQFGVIRVTTTYKNSFPVLKRAAELATPTPVPALLVLNTCERPPRAAFDVRDGRILTVRVDQPGLNCPTSATLMAAKKIINLTLTSPGTCRYDSPPTCTITSLDTASNPLVNYIDTSATNPMPSIAQSSCTVQLDNATNGTVTNVSLIESAFYQWDVNVALRVVIGGCSNPDLTAATVTAVIHTPPASPRPDISLDFVHQPFGPTRAARLRAVFDYPYHQHEVRDAKFRVRLTKESAGLTCAEGPVDGGSVADITVLDKGTMYPPTSAVGPTTPRLRVTCSGVDGCSQVGDDPAGFALTSTSTAQDAWAEATVEAGLVTKVSLVASHAGADYTAPPQVTVLSSAGRVLRVLVTNPGYGYAAPPTVEFSQPAFGAVARATAFIDAAGSVTSIQVTDPGYGYSTLPTVTIKPSGRIVAINLRAFESGYTASPSVVILGSGLNATATAQVCGGVLQSVTVTNGGFGYDGWVTASVSPAPPGATQLQVVVDTPAVAATATATVENADSAVVTATLNAQGGSVADAFTIVKAGPLVTITDPVLDRSSYLYTSSGVDYVSHFDNNGWFSKLAVEPRFNEIATTLPTISIESSSQRIAALAHEGVNQGGLMLQGATTSSTPTPIATTTVEFPTPGVAVYTFHHVQPKQKYLTLALSAPKSPYEFVPMGSVRGLGLNDWFPSVGGSNVKNALNLALVGAKVHVELQDYLEIMNTPRPAVLSVNGDVVRFQVTPTSRFWSQIFVNVVRDNPDPVEQVFDPLIQVFYRKVDSSSSTGWSVGSTGWFFASESIRRSVISSHLSFARFSPLPALELEPMPSPMIVEVKIGSCLFASGVRSYAVRISANTTTFKTAGGNCESSLDCRGAGSRAGLSANGASARFSDCVLGYDQVTAMCYECRADCDCPAGQYCFLPTQECQDQVTYPVTSKKFLCAEEQASSFGVCRLKRGVGKPCRSWDETWNSDSSTPKLPETVGSSSRDDTFCGEALYYSRSVSNTTGMLPAGQADDTVTNGQQKRQVTLWTGFCYAHQCRECLDGAVGCGAGGSGGRICVDGRWVEKSGVGAFQGSAADSQSARAEDATEDLTTVNLVSMGLLVVILLLIVVLLSIVLCCRGSSPARPQQQQQTFPPGP